SSARSWRRSRAGLWDQLRESAHRQHTPGQSRELMQWAEAVCELAEERLNRTAPPSAGPAAAARRRAGSLQPRLRVREPDDFTVRLFGPGRDSAW
ncbi:hypothetical protein DKT74_10630, partial [Streptomyces sp. ZEA17I]|uniref:hypothetical protein n=1 Tax=Streptomyces sp. ZEA17I TaxID=2202516 RepID=UPI000D9624BD